MYSSVSRFCPHALDPIGVRVHRLEADECERTAALLAWLTLEALRSGAVGRAAPFIQERGLTAASIGISG